MTEKELEKLFQAKLASRDLPFNVANWHKMEKMLDDAHTPAPMFYWRAVAAVLIFAVAVIPFIYYGSSGSTSREGNFTNQNFDFSGNEGSWEAIPDDQSREISQPVSSIAAVEIKEANSNSSRLATSEPASKHTTANRHLSEKKRLPASAANPFSHSIAENNLNSSQEIDNPTTAKEGYIWIKAKEIGVVAGERVLLSKEVLADFTPDAFHKFHKKHEWSVVGGVLFSNSHSSSQPGLGWHGGLRYQLRLNKDWLLSSGISYLVQNDVGINQQTDSTFYNFGQEKVRIDDNSNRLDYLTVPLHISYQPTARHEIGLGGYVSRLVQVSQTIESIYSSAHKPTEVVVTNPDDFSDRFNSYDAGLDLLYNYHFSPWLSVGVQLRQGFTDVTRDISNEFQKEHKNLNTRISIRYRIL